MLGSLPYFIIFPLQILLTRRRVRKVVRLLERPGIKGYIAPQTVKQMR